MSAHGQPELVDLTASPDRSSPSADTPQRPVGNFLQPSRLSDGPPPAAGGASLGTSPGAKQGQVQASSPVTGRGLPATESPGSPRPAKRRLPASFAAEPSSGQPKARRLATAQVHKPSAGTGSALSRRLASVTAYRPAAPTPPIGGTSPQHMQSVMASTARAPMVGHWGGQGMPSIGAEAAHGPSSAPGPAAAQRSSQCAEAGLRPAAPQVLPWATGAVLPPQHAQPAISSLPVGDAASSQQSAGPRRLPAFLAAISAQNLGRPMGPSARMPDQALRGHPSWQCLPRPSYGLTARSDADTQVQLLHELRDGCT